MLYWRGTSADREHSENGAQTLPQLISERVNADDGGLEQRDFPFESSDMNIDGTGYSKVVVFPDRVQQCVP